VGSGPEALIIGTADDPEAASSGVQIYTDGGCSGNPGPGAWAFVIIGHTFQGPGVLAEGSGGEAATTNNRMELLAVINALEKLKELRAASSAPAALKNNTAVFTDSQYVQKGMDEWLDGWKRKNWKTSDKKPVKNRELWLSLDALSAELAGSGAGIAWNWVKGHAGNRYNERCDSMVRREISRCINGE
jgi:ribonuclease HI